MKTITVCGRRFVPKGKLVDTLFTAGGTASGEYVRNRGGITFYRPDGKPFAALVINEDDPPFFVTASRSPTGRTRYMYGLSEPSRERLGLPEGFADSRRIAAEVARQAPERPPLYTLVNPEL